MRPGVPDTGCLGEALFIEDQVGAMQSRIFTIGSSTRTREEFLAILAAYAIRALADGPALPMSRRFPHFVRDHLAATLPLVGVSYHWLGKRLGG